MRSTTLRIAFLALGFTALGLGPGPVNAQEAPAGDLAYYRQPALRGDTLVFVAEGDLWRVAATGGVATRLTTHPASELTPAISFDGKTVAFLASYDGSREVFAMPLAGGRPTRLTFGMGRGSVAGFTPDGRVAYSTSRYCSVPSRQLALIGVKDRVEELVPLSQADQGAWSEDGTTLYFTRVPFQGSHAKRYKGGTAQNLWRFRTGEDEATPLTADYAGTSKNPMVWKGRLYFLSDRDGTMNVWSMDAEGADRDLRQVTQSAFMDIRSASLDGGRIAYRVGADIRLLDLETGGDAVVPIRLASDADQTRRKWIKDPHRFVTSAHLSPDGKRVVVTSRGRVAVAPVGKGRRYELPQGPTDRYRNARFGGKGKRIHLFSDATDEVELWSLPADGSPGADQLTKGGTIHRMGHRASPDGAYVAHVDKLRRLWLLDLKTREDRMIEDARHADLGGPVWSPDGRWLAYSTSPPQLADHDVLKLYDTQTGSITDLTTDRYSCRGPVFDPGGKWLYFLSNRRFASLVGGPWGSRQPEAYFDRQTLVYALALQPGLRPPFQEDDELFDSKEQAKEEKKKKKKKKEDAKKKDVGKDAKDEEGAEKKPAVKEAGKGKAVEIQLEGLRERLYQLPVPPGNYSGLVATAKHLQWLSLEDRHAGQRNLVAVQLGDAKVKLKTRMKKVTSIELSGDGKKLLVRVGKNYHVIKADSAAPVAGEALADTRVDLAGWTFSVDPRQEWRQMFDDAWRMHRDYFYDAGMHGVDWPAMRERYRPLVDRVRDRAELEDLTGMLISELSALHANVRGGDLRKGSDDVKVGFLGGRFVRDESVGGYRITHIPASDPDEPARRSPLRRQDLDVRVGDVIVAVNSRPALEGKEIGELLLNQVGRQVLLRIRRPEMEQPYEVVVKPITGRQDFDLRYHEWEYTRRLETEKLGGGRIGYLHLRAMGRGDMAQFTRDYYPIYNREGLIIDVRRNGGGNIDAWLLSRLMRKVWMYWADRKKQPYGNMHYAPRGHLIVLCDEFTSSDGEAFSDGFQRLGLGPVLGTRTWGGEIWLSGSNRLADGGVARAGQWGVYGRDGKWLIEGHGVDPDIVVDNLPHETFKGRDRQLERAVENLLGRIEKEPVPIPDPPPFPDKSVEDNRRR